MEAVRRLSVAKLMRWRESLSANDSDDRATAVTEGTTVNVQDDIK